MLASWKLRIIFNFLLLAVLSGTAMAQDYVDSALNGNIDALRQALPEGVATDPEALVRPLYFAARQGHADVVSFLLERGAPADAVTNIGTALQIAARGNHTDVMTILLEAGANPNLPGGDESKMPLHDAAERGAIEAARLLIQYGADVNARTGSYGQPAIHLAARKGKTEMVAFLREMGAAPAPVAPLAPGEIEAANLEEGRIEAIECQGCHELEPGQTTSGAHTGPKLIGVVGRGKASRDDFAYSDAMKAQSGSWTPNELIKFIADPTGVVPGTHMGHRGVSDRQARVALIAYLMSLGDAAK